MGREHDQRGPLYIYDQEVNAGHFKMDGYQRHVVKYFQHLHEALREYRPSAISSGGLLDGFLGGLFSSASQKGNPRGLYLYGSVGCGKTMLMDLFFEGAPVPTERKRRVILHDFLLDVHHRTHRFTGKAVGNVITAVAHALSRETWLLCLDEVFIKPTDIWGASVIRDLLHALLEKGTVVVCTSNRKPEDLYMDGLNRHQVFPPFLKLLRDNFDVYDMESGMDYRLNGTTSTRLYHAPLNEETREAMQEWWEVLTRNRGLEAPTTIDVGFSRQFHVSRTVGEIGWFSFRELCAMPRGATDFLAIGRTFSTVFVNDIPKLSTDVMDQADRFVNLIDVLYEKHVRLICSAATFVEDLFETGTEEAGGEGREIAFVFQRTLSRLTEMFSDKYLEQCDAIWNAKRASERSFVDQASRVSL